MDTPPPDTSADPTAPALPIRPAPTFLQQLAIVTLSLLLLVLAIWLLREFKSILQPLLIALLIGYICQPIHRALQNRGFPQALSYVVIFLLIIGLFLVLGTLVYKNVEQIIERMPAYEIRIERYIHEALGWAGVEVDPERRYLQDLSRMEFNVMSALGSFGDFFAAMMVTFVYLIFLIPEKVGFRRRVFAAFGTIEGTHVQEVLSSINHAITEYLSVKTFVSFVAGVLSTAVLAVFGVDFYITWGILIFLFNYIPYLGSMVAIALPVIMSFLMLEQWQAIVVAILLIAIQEVIGIYMEPRMAGQKLGVSPLLILVALAFWGVVWGIVGMILAVPLLMVLKITLENIKATKPLAVLMSNV